MCQFVGGISIIVILVLVAAAILISRRSGTKFSLDLKGRTPFKLAARDEQSVTLTSSLNIVNDGSQCGVIMDCFTRHLLPYEQFSDVKVESKIQVASRKLGDDYFEALLIEKAQQAECIVTVKLTSSTGESIDKVLKNMVDLPIDIVYEHVARNPWKLEKERIVLTIEELAEALK